mmetsp:Transcript_47385/g.101147  ORF Transcript_47385/g.101147 Transcript_47385/m.101147 type:complete len:249 (-) Transcript_47385:226-972(-)
MLGHHHERGIILPLAVGDVPTEGGAHKHFNVGRNAGCSSALPLNQKSNRLKWCKAVSEQRTVPMVSLEALLGWAARPVDFLKIDAQGLDTTIVASARGRLTQVRRFQLEVIADDCDSLYEGQPKCSEVLAQAAKLGFAPASTLRCRPEPQLRSKHWRKTAWGCELEIVFLANGVSMLPPLWQFHNLGHSGCASVHSSMSTVPNGTYVMLAPNKWVEKDASGKQPRKVNAQMHADGIQYQNGLYECMMH